MVGLVLFFVNILIADNTKKNEPKTRYKKLYGIKNDKRISDAPEKNKFLNLIAGKE